MNIRAKQTEGLSFKVDKETLEFLDSEAALFNTTRSEIIKAAINNYRFSHCNKNEYVKNLKNKEK